MDATNLNKKLLLFITCGFCLFINAQQVNNFKIFTKEHFGGSNLTFTPGSELVNKIEKRIRRTENCLWKNSVRQYRGINHPKDGRYIKIIIIPNFWIKKRNLKWEKKMDFKNG